MALIVGLWGVWQLISGLALALWWGRVRERRDGVAQSPRPEGV
jgi:hypothetical protein